MRRIVLRARICALAALVAASIAVAQTTANPPAEGFNAAGSDAEAIAVADRVMAAMGGRDAWDRTRYLTWRFFGQRFHVWDKQTGDIRVEGTGRDDDEPYVILMNIHSKEGRAWRGGEEITDSEALDEMLDRGESSWINDSYWLVMPYKLKDSGVTLRHLGEGELEDGRTAEILELTFEAVGRTPENKYHVYVAKDSGLVERWDYFSQASDTEPRLSTPWLDWQRHGEILLSANRGARRHTDIAVLDEVPAGTFTSPEPVELN